MQVQGPHFEHLRANTEPVLSVMSLLSSRPWEDGTNITVVVQTGPLQLSCPRPHCSSNLKRSEIGKEGVGERGKWGEDMR